jgi:pyrimidine-nucleoside phosphorylase
MSFLSLIEAKREGHELPGESIAGFVQEFVRGRIQDYQMAAMLMAIFFQGLRPAETRALTLAMRDSGEVLRFPADSRPIVDKHSTGGVGDKVSLPLAPLLACLGFRVPMVSGRGLGITGGTLDKLESIPGFTTALEPARIIDQVQRIGLAMAGQTATLVPADKLLYALRDVTGTVPSVPLITSSILSKKLAEGLEALVLDVKFGRAAFMATLDQARELARSLVELAKACGLDARALLTDMNSPLGRSAGNWLEVKEAVACLEGGGPIDVRELMLECAAQLLVQTRRVPDVAEGRRQAQACLASGAPRRKWDELLMAQGADLEEFTRRRAHDHHAPVTRELSAPRAGFVERCDARVVGEVVRSLGGGRAVKEDAVHPDVGVDHLAKPGDKLDKGSLLGRVHAGNDEHARLGAEQLSRAFTIADQRPRLDPLIREVM